MQRNYDDDDDQIGVILRDSNGIAQVKSVTGNKVLRILKKAGELASWHHTMTMNMTMTMISLLKVGVILFFREWLLIMSESFFII